MCSFNRIKYLGISFTGARAHTHTPMKVLSTWYFDDCPSQPHTAHIKKVEADKAGERPLHQDTVRSSAALGWIPVIFCLDSKIEAEI